MNISIITPSFNQGQYIARTIQSVLSQEVAGLDYWVMDGGSSDDTLAILKQYSHSLQFISEKDSGQAHAVNKGFKKARGEILGWLNSDDIYYPGTLQKVLTFFQENPKLDFVYGDAHHIDEHDRIIDRYPSEPWNIKRLYKTCYLAQPAVFFRRNVLERLGLLDESLQFCMDYEYWLRAALMGLQFAYLPTFLSGSRLHAQTKTLSAPWQATQEAVHMLQGKLGYVPLQWLINLSALQVKNKTHYRFPHLKYLGLLGVELITVICQNRRSAGYN